MTGTWRTRIHGNTYRLTETGQLQKEAPMSNTHIQRMTEQQAHHDAHSAVAEELEALQARLTERHAKEQNR